MTIITYQIDPRCKDCKYCGYVTPLKKDGEYSRKREYYCAIKDTEWIGNKRVYPRNYACKNFEMSRNGFISPLSQITSSLSQ